VTTTTSGRATGAGPLLRAWRQRRRLSQLDLACLAEVSTRHLSCVETGRARPSRAFLLHLCEHLDVPLRGRNELLVAAGYAPEHTELPLDAPQMAAVHEALALVLRHAEPFPAVVVDRHWDLVRANAGVGLLLDLVDPDLLARDTNVLRLSMHPDGLAPHVVDLPGYAAHVLARLRRQAGVTGDPGLLALHDELAALVPAASTTVGQPHDVVLPLRLRTPHGELAFFTTLAVFGSAADVTLAELAVEQFFPADERTGEVVRALAGSAWAGGPGDGS
jgi:transcriptional regulator with XRE-family HTH domain